MTQTTHAPTLLRLASVFKAFGGVQALTDVSFELCRGEVHALIGENSAGKTTLIKIVTAVHAPDAGTLEIDGQTIERNDPTRAIGHCRHLSAAAIRRADRCREYRIAHRATAPGERSAGATPAAGHRALEARRDRRLPAGAPAI